MAKDEKTEDERSVLVRRKMASIGLHKIEKTINGFEEDRIFNKRVALLGFVSLLIALSVFLAYDFILEVTEKPDYEIVGTIESLVWAQDKHDGDRKRYLARVKLSGTEKVFASVDPDIYSKLKPGDEVIIGYYEKRILDQYEILRKENPNDP